VCLCVSYHSHNKPTNFSNGNTRLVYVNEIQCISYDAGIELVNTYYLEGQLLVVHIDNITHLRQDFTRRLNTKRNMVEIKLQIPSN
jgi:hypothetical protein